MKAKLRLASNNTHPAPGRKISIAALHQLADRLIGQVRSGNALQAHDTVADEHLNPLGIAVLATWLYRAGLSEGQILDVVA